MTNRGFVTQGGITGSTATDNTVHSMRSGAYLNRNGSGTISGNTVYNTKGDCKEGGWERFTSPTFNNQGQRVSHCARQR